MLSRYAIPFEKEDKKFVYVSRSNNFYELSADAFSFIKSLDSRDEAAMDADERDFCQSLRERGIIADEADDDTYLEEQKMLYLTSALATTRLGLTIAPTISCNLRCPYCFEESKPGGSMSDETIDTLIEFIKSHEFARHLSITWFGGEPLLCVDKIERILEKVSQLEEIKLVNHVIITNATMLGDEAIRVFKQYPLGSMQITFDGNKATHDTKRIYADGSGSFDIILANARRFAEACPDTSISFRINVDNRNSDEYFEIHDILSREFAGKNINIYPGILTANRGCESETFFTTKDHVAFAEKMRRKGISKSLFPMPESKGCCATSVSSHVIGPRGELYRCWEHVGIPDKEVGNIADERLSRPGLFARFVNLGHCFDDPRCRRCGLLPICNGGCAKRRLLNGEINAGYDLCTIYNDNNAEALADLLYNYYLSTADKKTAEHTNN